MTADQKQWLADHPDRKVWRPHVVVSISQWADVGYLFPSGEFVPEGRSHGWAWPMHLMSSGDTLYAIPEGAVKVGREYMLC